MLYDASKRAVDIVVALFVLVVFSPLWLVIALIIRMTSPGPALFRRTIVGQGGREFTYYKFRSMVAGDDEEHYRWLRDFVQRDAPAAGGDYKVRHENRVTPVGRWLRRWSLDEIPQFINVLRGEMSVVGPRPPTTYEYSLYDEAARRKLSVKPGITGIGQVTARSRLPFSKLLELELSYASQRSLWLDLKIIAKTPWVMLHGRGAG